MSTAAESRVDPKRDLSFRPIVNDNPHTLTREQVDHYNEKGYIPCLDVFSDEQANANRQYFNSLMQAVIDANDGRDGYSINGYQDRCRGLYDLIMEPRILHIVQDICGPDVICWGAHYFCKMPGDKRSVSWHQDASYWPFETSQTVTAWLAIDDSTPENGAMKVIPGTHSMGHLPFRASSEADNNVLNQTIESAEKYGDPVQLCLKAGQISLHADMLAHGSEPNLSDTRRCGLTIRYCPASVRGDWNVNSIICRGSDPSGHWGNIPRPEGDNPAAKPHQLVKK